MLPNLTDLYCSIQSLMDACYRISLLCQFTEETNHDSPQLQGGVAQAARLYALRSRVILFKLENVIPEQG